MFEFSEDLLLKYDSDFETLSLDCFTSTNRKNSFIDLLSYEKSTQNSDLDIINIDHCSLDLPILQVCSEELDQVTLLLDHFPYLNPVQRPKLEASRKVSEAAKEGNEKIGTLSIQERVKRIDRYLEKKKKRTWVRKIHYNCRKRVADKRLRIKGRFVTSNKKK